MLPLSETHESKTTVSREAEIDARTPFLAVRSNRLSLRFRSIIDYLRGFYAYECPIIGGVRVSIAYSSIKSA